MFTLAERFWDALLGRFAWYRRWTGGKWECDVIAPDPATGWDDLSDREEWRRIR